MAINDLGRVTPMHRGDYNPLVEYELNDIVEFNLSHYWHVLDDKTTGIDPSDTSVWKIITNASTIPDAVARAEQYALDAENSAESAGDSATDANLSKTQAETAKGLAEDAQEAAEEAQEAAELAQTKAEAAQLAAETAKGLAETAKTAAETAKTQAETAKTNSEAAKVAAETAKGLAESARDAAAASATNAAASATAAATAKTAAETAKTAAETAKSGADSSASAAALSATAAATAKTAAETAQGKAEDAQQSAELAKLAAETAKSAAEAAVGKTSYVGANGNWYQWNAGTSAFIDTGVHAQGDKGDTGKGYRPQGSWVSGTSYVNDVNFIDVVYYNGSTYYCRNSTSGTTAPNLDTTNWGLLAASGSLATGADVLLTGYAKGTDATAVAATDNVNQAFGKVENQVDKKLDKNGDGKDVTVTFTEAGTRANIATGESAATMFGKIKKFFTDLKPVAFSGSYNDLGDKPPIATDISSAIGTHNTATDSHSTLFNNKLDKTGDGKDVTVTFTEAATRATVNSGETQATMWGKIKKLFTDLKSVAFSGSYNDLGDKPTAFPPASHTHGNISNAGTFVDGNAPVGTAASGALTAWDHIQFLTNLGYGSANCIDAASTVAKVANMDGYTRRVGGLVLIKFTNENTAASPTLNITSNGAFPIFCNGAAVKAGMITAGMIAILQWDGTNYNLLNPATGDCFYGSSSTAAATVEKAVTCPRFSTQDLRIGSTISVYFTIANTAASMTLNINGTGAKTVYFSNTTDAKGKFFAYDTITFVYDGASWKVERVKSIFTTVTLLATAWMDEKATLGFYFLGIGGTELPVLETDAVHMNLVQSDTVSTAQAQIEAYNLISRGKVVDGSINLFCYDEKPAINLSVTFEIRR